jgi:integration host factor subunit alpha
MIGSSHKCPTGGLFHPYLQRPSAVYFLFPHKLPLNLPGYIRISRSNFGAIHNYHQSHIIEALFAKNIFNKTESAQVIDTLFELIKQSLQNGEDVLISEFGKFSVKEKHQRIGRNPQTGEPVTLPPRKVVTFKCSGILRAGMNGESD